VTEENWSNMYAYAWQIDDETQRPLGYWPGTKINVDSDGWHSQDITDGSTVGIVINAGNGQSQLGDMKPLSTDTCYHLNLQAFVDTPVNCETEGPILTPAYTIKWRVVDGTWNEMYIYVLCRKKFVCTAMFFFCFELISLQTKQNSRKDLMIIVRHLKIIRLPNHLALTLRPTKMMKYL
jgi:hypothetical protein